ncbi:MAG TPA: ABC transporter permease [Acidimicrobiia bacterium]|nr:ABC transporter permease [Acidimicrobiia bacterium]
MEGVASLIDFIVGRSDEVVTATTEHLQYVIATLVTATVISVAVGIWVRHRPFPREITLGIASVFLTLPSLALFVIFIPLTGLGFMPAYIALTMYAILPILRNTVTGLNGVSPAVLESARGMGLSSVQRLWRIELPLAWPVIVTGVRVSMLLTTGIAAIAVLVGGGGLGTFILSGLRRLGLPNSYEAMWAGTLLVIALALVLDAVFIFIRRFTTSPGLR